MASSILSVPITFNGVSVGKEKVSVGIGIDHARVSREQMGELFVNRQLDCELITGEPGEQSLPGIETDRVEINATFTARSYSEKKDGFGTRLTITKSEIDPSDLWDVAGRSGFLTVRQSRAADTDGGGSLPGQMEFAEEDDEPDDAEPDDNPRPSPVVEEPNHGGPIGDLEEIEVPMTERSKHQAWVYVQEFPTCWVAGWDWEGDQGGGANNGPDIRRSSRDAAISAAAGQLVDSLQQADTLPSKAAKDRRAAAIKSAQTFYGDAERGGVTVFEAAG